MKKRNSFVKKVLCMLLSASMLVPYAPAFAADDLPVEDAVVAEETSAQETAEEDACAEEAVDQEVSWSTPSATWYEDYDYETEGSKIWLTASKGKLSGNITVPAKAVIDGTEYRVGVKPNGVSIWQTDGDAITGIRFEKGVEAADYLDSLCSGLGELKIADLSGLDTSKVISMRFLFMSCSKLEEVDLEGVKTGLVQEFDFMFMGCRSLKAIDVSGFDTSNALKMNAVFTGCSSLTSLDVSNFDTSNVTWMDSMFSYCSGLTSLDISNFVTSKVQSMSSLFNGCENLKKLELGELNTGDVMHFNDMFHDCRALEELDLHSFRTTCMTEMKSMFQNCTALKQLDIRSFDMTKLNENHTEYVDPAMYFLTNSGVEELDLPKKAMSGHDFSEYEKLKLICYVGSEEEWAALNNIVPSGVTVSCNMPQPKPEVDLYSWYNDYDHEISGKDILIHASKGTITDGRVIIPATAIVDGETYNTVLDSVNNLDTDPYNWKSLWEKDKDLVTDIVIQKGVKSTQNLGGLFKGMPVLADVDISGLDTSSVTDMDMLFSNCYKLSGVKLGNPDTSKVTNMRWMFANCIELLRIDVSGLDTQNVTNVTGMFSGMTNLKSLDVSSFDMSSAVEMYNMFSDCKTLESLDLSTFNTANAKYMGAMFDDCESLTSINLNGFDTSSVETVMGMFNNCTSLKSLDLSSFNMRKCKNFSEMFWNSSNLESITFGPEFVTGEATDMSTMFCNCRKLKSLDLSSFNTYKVENMVSMFAGCESLNHLDLGSFKTSKNKNHNCMFERCYSLRELDLRSFDFEDVIALQKLTADSGITHLYLPEYAMKNYDFTSGYSEGKFVLSNIYYAGTEEEWAAKNNTYPESVTVSCNFTGEMVPLEKVVESVSLNHSEVTIKPNESIQLKATVTPEDATNTKIRWSIKYETDEISVDQSGKVTATDHEGRYIVVATAEDRGLVSAECVVIVKKDSSGDDPKPGPGPSEVPGGDEATDSQPAITADTDSLTLVQGQKFNIGKGWGTKDTKVLSVNKKTGAVKAKKTGTATITHEDGVHSIAVTIVKPTVTSKLAMEAGETKEISLSDASDLNVVWCSSAPDVATVDENGQVTAVAKGSAKITAWINGTAYKTTVKVNETTAAAERTLHLNVGKSKNVKIKGLKKTVWTAAEEDAAQEIVEIKGSKIKAKKAGEITLTADAYTLKVIVEDPSIAGSTLKTAYKQTIEMTAGDTKYIKLTDVKQDVIFKSNKNSVAFISTEETEDGYMISARSKGTAKITAKVNGKTISITVKVK